MVTQKMWIQNLNHQSEREERRTDVTIDDMESGIVQPQQKDVKKTNHAMSKDVDLEAESSKKKDGKKEDDGKTEDVDTESKSPKRRGRKKNGRYHR